MNPEQRLNQALALLDVLATILSDSRRLLNRIAEDAVDQQERIGEALDEYERLAAKWADEDSDE